MAVKSADVTISFIGPWTIFSGLTPKGTEWLLRTLKFDKNHLSYTEMLIHKHAMEKEGLSVEVLDT